MDNTNYRTIATAFACPSRASCIWRYNTIVSHERGRSRQHYEL
ncbi:hypothetical protein [Pontibacter fetidus]|nr:hypothetical protein [Pontibacter fetidus]